ncbi:MULTISPECIES: hypothetical protein [Moorena]|uniref:Uncharacterized protein n=1 Tax=Moorena producens (strain JHB) TaxID=1454205 RepID=A0A9Q9UW90_MOOP1|nr:MULTISPECIES: hypothetical protein [Moorena]NES81208.1 hypothetical protein [Moorena sp. SIO2B7]NEP33661.1 hypothetical protein [Moorena sp. SIO3B2]NEP67649.1 hypothetical protein [Moorena sp. SIO3A5]NEQ08797.1 hypothetical protein [Moorena sp. SIO4E2]NER86979.1 hypothetical protein [Moorena sp. SIO3A2]
MIIFDAIFRTSYSRFPIPDSRFPIPDSLCYIISEGKFRWVNGNQSALSQPQYP